MTPYDLVITDFLMPSLTELALARIRGADPGLPILMVAASEYT